MNKHMKDLIKKIEAQGGSARITRKRHVQFRDAEGRVAALGAGTPSDPRSWRNLLAELKRAGFHL